MCLSYSEAHKDVLLVSCSQDHVRHV